MSFAVYELPKALLDKRQIFTWLFERSPQGAAAWLNAYDEMVERLRMAAASLALAQENSELDLETREIMFKTKRGRVYRAVFHLDGENVFILRLRGPGQAPISDDQLT